MKVQLLDTQTGEKRDGHADMTLWYWSEGNGSCDCNRSIAWEEKDLDEEQRIALGLEENICLGTRRFLVCDAEGDWEWMATKERFLKEANDSYPIDLRQKFGLP